MKSFNHTCRALAVGLMLLGSFLTAQAEVTKQTLSQGTWQEKNTGISGLWELRQVGDNYILVFDKAFATNSAPDLKVFLHPRGIADIDDDNATQGALFVSKLKNNKGRQVYQLPKGTKPGDYQSLIIHCERYSVLWGGAPLIAK